MVCPNPSFMRQLLEYERQLWDRLSEEEGDLRTQWVVCPSVDTLRAKILEESCLWAENLVHETDFDRIPIQAFKRSTLAALPPELPSEGQDDSANSEGAASAVRTEQKPKKPFLKRGQGKTILKTKNKPSPSPATVSATTPEPATETPAKPAQETLATSGAPTALLTPTPDPTLLSANP